MTEQAAGRMRRVGSRLMRRIAAADRRHPYLTRQGTPISVLGGFLLGLLAEAVSQQGLLAIVIPAVSIAFVAALILYMGRDDPPGGEVGTGKPHETALKALPGPPRNLLGRDREVSATVAMAREGLAVVTGADGMGTSAVALCAAWEVASERRARHYIDAKGSSRERSEDALGVALRVRAVLGLSTGQIETAEEAMPAVAEALRNTGGVLLLDNLTEWDQVAWIDPVPGAHVIIAGTIAPPARVNACHVGPLEDSDGLAMLSERLDDPARLDADKDAALRLARDHLHRPQSIIEIARWLNNRPKVTIAASIGEIKKGNVHLLSQHLQDVSAPARRILALLVRCPLTALTQESVAALTGAADQDAVGERLEELTHQCLIEPDRYSRYHVMEDARHLRADVPPAWDRAWWRLVIYFAAGASAQAVRLPAEEAKEWFRAEDMPMLELLRVARSPWALPYLWQIADALDIWFARERRRPHRERAAAAMAEATTSWPDRDAQTAAEIRRCLIALAHGDPGPARAYFDLALERSGGRPWSAQLHLTHAQLLMATGDNYAAIEKDLVHYGQALPHGDRAGATTLQINMAALRVRRAQAGGPPRGHHVLTTGQLTEAQHLLTAAAGTTDPRLTAAAQELLGLVAEGQGLPHAALDSLREAEASYRRVGDPDGQGRCLAHQGAVVLLQKRPEEAIELLNAAVTLLPPRGLATALAHLHLAEATGVSGHGRAGLQALSGWDGVAEPVQVTETRERLTVISGGGSPTTSPPAT